MPFIVPDFTEDEYAAGLEVIRQYSLPLTSSLKIFGRREQGAGDLDRCAGVFIGQLGVPVAFVQYTSTSHSTVPRPLEMGRTPSRSSPRA